MTMHKDESLWISSSDDDDDNNNNYYYKYNNTEKKFKRIRQLTAKYLFEWPFAVVRLSITVY